jgi:predicted nucleic acid-binding Zn finger protein
LDTEDAKIRNLIDQKKIKRKIFIPSKNEIWEIKGYNNKNVYWIDFNKKYCSCKGFYYNIKNGTCYHIRAVQMAIIKNGYDLEFLQDNNLNRYLGNLLDNLLNNNR